jgi:hypothetical protein
LCIQRAIEPVFFSFYIATIAVIGIGVIEARNMRGRDARARDMGSRLVGGKKGQH